MNDNLKFIIQKVQNVVYSQLDEVLEDKVRDIIKELNSK